MMGLALAIEFPVGLIIALSIQRITIGKSFFSILMVIPLALPPVVVAIMFRIMYNPIIGVFNYFLKMIGIAERLWLDSVVEVIPSLAIVDAYIWTPFIVLVLLSGLNSLPKEQYEAAMIDGASSWQIFRRITIPLLMPFIIIALLFRIMGLLGTFDIILASTGGGPGTASQTLYYYAYSVTFTYLNFGYGSALTVVLLYLMVIISLIILKYVKIM
jgi:multiple sugar transport system permease protein